MNAQKKVHLTSGDTRANCPVSIHHLLQLSAAGKCSNHWVHIVTVDADDFEDIDDVNECDDHVIM